MTQSHLAEDLLSRDFACSPTGQAGSTRVCSSQPALLRACLWLILESVNLPRTHYFKHAPAVGSVLVRGNALYLLQPGALPLPGVGGCDFEPANIGLKTPLYQPTVGRGRGADNELLHDQPQEEGIKDIDH